MSVCSDISDYDWLTGDEAAVLLIELAASELPLHTAVGRLRRHLSPAADAPRRGAGRATPPGGRQVFPRRPHVLHAHRPRTSDRRTGRRLQSHAIRPASRSVSDGRMPHFADLCCGIGGDLLALAKQGTMIAVDRCPIAAHFAAANVRAVVPSSDVQFRTIDADRHRISMTSPPGTSIPIAAPPAAAQRRSNAVSRTSPTSSDCLRQVAERRHQTRAGHQSACRVDRALRTRMDQPRPRMPPTRRLARRPGRVPRPTPRNNPSQPLAA